LRNFRRNILIILVTTIGLYVMAASILLDPIYRKYVSRPAELIGFWMYETGAEIVEQAKMGANTAAADLPWAPVVDQSSPVRIGGKVSPRMKDFIKDIRESNFMGVVHIGARNQPYFPIYPSWFFTYFPQVIMQDKNNMSIKVGSSITSSWPSFDASPIVYGSTEYVKKTTEKYADEERIKYWVMGGEQFYPGVWADYNPTAVHHFQEWLKVKYKSLESLNAAWSTNFSSWSKVEPTKNYSTKDIRYLDWLLFRDDNTNEQFQYTYQAIISNDSNTPVFAPVHGSVYTDSMRANFGMDLNGYAMNSDGFETGQIMRDKDPTYFNMMYYEFLNGFQKPVAPGRLAYKKTDPSAIGGGTSFTPEAARRYFYESLGMGAWHIGFVQWQGTAHDGEWGIKGTPAQTEIGKLFSEVKTLKNYLMFMSPIKPEIAIYASNFDWVLEGWKTSWKDMHLKFIWEHIPKVYLSDLSLRKRILEGYKILVAVDNSVIGREKLSLIEDFVNDGGILIADNSFALKDEMLRNLPEFPARDDGLFSWSENWKKVDETEDYCIYQLGRGKAYVLKTENETLKTQKIIQLCKKMIDPVFIFENANRYGAYTETFTLFDGANYMIVLVNTGNRDSSIIIKSNKVDIGKAEPLLNTGKISFDGENFNITLSKFNTEVLYFRTGDSVPSSSLEKLVSESAATGTVLSQIKRWLSDETLMPEKRIALMNNFDEWIEPRYVISTDNERLLVKLDTEDISESLCQELRMEVEVRPFGGIFDLPIKEALDILLDDLRPQYDYYEGKYTRFRFPMKLVITIYGKGGKIYGQSEVVVKEEGKEITNVACNEKSGDDQMKEKVIVVTDISLKLFQKDPDDAYAILYGILSDNIDIKGIVTTYGNSPLDQVNRSIGIFLSKLGRKNIPVYEGCEMPLKRSLISERAKEIDSIFDKSETDVVQLGGVDFLINEVLKNPKEITLISIGPMTAIAEAMLKEPRFADSVKRVLIMGGAVYWPKKKEPLPEWNILCDPDAAKIVFEGQFEMVLFPLDVTMKTRLKRETLLQISAESDILDWLREATESWFEMPFNKDGIPLHDLLPFIYLDDETLFTFKEIPLSVVISKKSRDYGKTLIVEEGKRIKTAIDVYVSELLELTLNIYKQAFKAN